MKCLHVRDCSPNSDKVTRNLLEVIKYLLLTELEVRTVSYGPSFFPFDLWPKREADRED